MTGAAGMAAGAGYRLSDTEIAEAAAFMRRDVGPMKATNPILVAYGKAIKKMKTLPTTDPLSWAYQAAIHGTTLSGTHPAWNTCEHGSNLFWPWHRMYLYWFEKIIRKMSGDAGWALPYWNWSSMSERQLPAPFRDPTSELFTNQRNPAMNSGAGSLPSPDVSFAAAFVNTDFTLASASLEGVPHGQVHVDVGGWMGSVPTAAQDPIFYLHHCNIDRLWNLWLAQGGGRSDPLGNNTWKNTVFTFFDENGHEVKMKACDVLRAAQQLQYTYEGEPTQVNQFCALRIPISLILKIAVLFNFPGPPVTLTGQVVTVPLETGAAQQRIASAAANPGEKLLLQLDGVEAENSPGASWEVYYGLPPNVQPSTESPFYVGNVVLFGSGIRSEAHHGFTPAKFQFEINRAAQAAQRANARPALTFVPHGILVDGKPSRPEVKSPVKIGKVTLASGTETNATQ